MRFIYVFGVAAVAAVTMCQRAPDADPCRCCSYPTWIYRHCDHGTCARVYEFPEKCDVASEDGGSYRCDCLK